MFVRNNVNIPEFGDKLILKLPTVVMETNVSHLVSEDGFYDKNPPKDAFDNDKRHVHTSYKYCDPRKLNIDEWTAILVPLNIEALSGPNWPKGANVSFLALNDEPEFDSKIYLEIRLNTLRWSEEHKRWQFYWHDAGYTVSGMWIHFYPDYAILK